MSATAATTGTLSVCRDVGVTFGSAQARVEALRGIDISIDGADRLALWGRSGSGKTTVLHVLGGLLVPTTGTVTWRNEPLSGLDTAARGRLRARGIAYIFQGSNLLPHFTAYENVAFAQRTAGPVEPDRVEHLLTLVGLADKLDALPAELSGGEAQRVAIARALAQRPQMLLCDEPTGHLDSDTGERVLDLIDTLHAEFGFAMVTATHNTDVAARADRTLRLHDGRIVAEPGA
jgi:putative ABC transport system ATP-binding protein